MGSVVWSIVWMIGILLISVGVVIYYIMRYDHFGQMTREYAKNREEYFREFHSVVAPVVVIDGYDYERKYDEEPSFCKHSDE